MSVWENPLSRFSAALWLNSLHLPFDSCFCPSACSRFLTWTPCWTCWTITHLEKNIFRDQKFVGECLHTSARTCVRVRLGLQGIVFQGHTCELSSPPLRLTDRGGGVWGPHLLSASSAAGCKHAVAARHLPPARPRSRGTCRLMLVVGTVVTN